MTTKDTEDVNELAQLSPDRSTQAGEVTQVEESVESKEVFNTFPIRTRKKRQRPCRYFNTPKGCRMGDSCPFEHQKKLNLNGAEVGHRETQEANVEDPRTNDTPAVQVVVPRNIRSNRYVPAVVRVSREQKGEKVQLDAEKSDIMFFKRRFPKCIHTSSDGKDVIAFNYQVFDVRSIHFRVILHPGHPVDIPSVSVPIDHNEALPELLISHIESSFNEALKTKHATFESKNAFEPFGKASIRWLDRNILSLFVAGLKKTKLVKEAEQAGIRLVVPNVEPAKPYEENELKAEPNDDESTPSEGSNLGLASADALAHLSLSAEQPISQDNAESQAHSLPLQSIPQIEVALIWRDTSRNIASISSICLHICSKCVRCGQEHDVPIPVDDQTVGWRCKRCQIAQSLRLRPELVHENSSVMALLDARGCRPLDCILQQSQLKFVCLACGKEDEVQKLNFGSTHKSWCRECHTLCEFTVTAVRFRGDLSKIPAEDLVTASKIPKAKKEVTKPLGAIFEGQPLPELGTCKHYKKSYRWFRFPCCGRAFPCDICHEESVGGEHEMKFANRMICGHCSKEQSYTAGKPCVSCNSSVTRSRSQFWEGGKGCRDQTMMSRNDAHKFTHRNKTIAKKKSQSAVTKK
ncbi:hypothetical protein ANCCAN_04545 [Ancylostoma caninum]|uniref:CHY zinc finger n=1 Tax=Ancylostoma caninum TaxID=29170 RepID=A0A368H1Z2_ANCCA|nr:hypothetical protein ANCCAN_04545 [Ancylostoma caninum]